VSLDRLQDLFWRLYTAAKNVPVLSGESRNPAGYDPSQMPDFKFAIATKLSEERGAQLLETVEKAYNIGEMKALNTKAVAFSIRASPGNGSPARKFFGLHPNDPPLNQPHRQFYEWNDFPLADFVEDWTMIQLTNIVKLMFHSVWYIHSS
jgi:hypothetical protein